MKCKCDSCENMIEVSEDGYISVYCNSGHWDCLEDDYKSSEYNCMWDSCKDFKQLK